MEGSASTDSQRNSVNHEEEKKLLALQMEDHDWITKFEDYMCSRLDIWRTKTLNIAITGNSGSGKSMLINTLRGLLPSDPGAAQTGFKETTSAKTPYPHPNNQNLIFWDLPGVGTNKYRQATYMSTMQFDYFDFVLIVASNRFTENDQWLALELNNLGRKFYFVRTKLDETLDNDKDNYPTQFTVEGTIEKCRKNCVENLSIESKGIYIISGILGYPYGEFGRLMEDLVGQFEGLKRDALIFSLTSNCKEIVTMKVEALRQQNHFEAEVIYKWSDEARNYLRYDIACAFVIDRYKAYLGLTAEVLDTLQSEFVEEINMGIPRIKVQPNSDSMKSIYVQKAIFKALNDKLNKLKDATYEVVNNQTVVKRSPLGRFEDSNFMLGYSDSSSFSDIVEYYRRKCLDFLGIYGLWKRAKTFFAIMWCIYTLPMFYTGVKHLFGIYVGAIAFIVILLTLYMAMNRSQYWIWIYNDRMMATIIPVFTMCLLWYMFSYKISVKVFIWLSILNFVMWGVEKIYVSFITFMLHMQVI